MLVNRVSHMEAGKRFPSKATALALAVCLAVWLAVCLAGCGSGRSSSTATTSPSPSTPKPVAMPTVVGYTVPFAKQTDRTNGLQGPTRVIATPNGAWPRSRITATNPPGGKVVLSDSRVIFYVASGPARCEQCTGTGAVRRMPDVCGLTFQQANTLLVERGITLSQHPIRRPSAKARGTIIGSVPAARTSFIAYGGRSVTEVVVTISSGQTAPATGSQPSC